MQNKEQRAEVAENLDARLKSAIETAVERQERVGALSSWWRDIREANHFRKSLEELFSGE